MREKERVSNIPATVRYARGSQGRNVEDGFSTFYHSQSLNYDYKKTITEGENGGVKISYEITNTGSDDFRCMWAAHFMAAAEKGGYAVTPFEDGRKGRDYV